MQAEKKRRLEARGWKVGSVEEFLGLTPEEAASLEQRLSPTDSPHGGTTFNGDAGQRNRSRTRS